MGLARPDQGARRRRCRDPVLDIFPCWLCIRFLLHSIIVAGRILVSRNTMDEADAMPHQLPTDEEPGPPAFVDAVLMQQSLVFSIAYHLLHNVPLAEEIAQDVFVRLYQDYSKIQNSSHLVFWLRRTTMHRCLDLLRHSERHPHVPLEDVNLPAPASSEDQDPILARSLRRLVAELPASARAVVVLRFQEDLEPREIAQVLDLPVNTVKSRLQRALIVLRGKLTSDRGVAS
jgi:RNA polymerase sigma-70 factor, ECF subfamily